jgi:hypothetical protein
MMIVVSKSRLGLGIVVVGGGKSERGVCWNVNLEGEGGGGRGELRE